MSDWEFFEEGDAIGVIRQCADGMHEIGCYTDAWKESYTCFVQSIDRDEAAVYIEGEACPDPHMAYYELDLKAPSSLVEYGDPFFAHHDSDEHAMVSALKQHGLWC